MRKLLLAAAIVAVVQGTASAADDLDKVNMGQHWYGPERTLASLKGHIVLWEKWGHD
jgi:hypothetical protein